ncbi:MAG: ABC transporter ATP-binding protein [Anaerolineales bacterium]|nr:ABC transporter ATP-binding protein [Anaerolineales bacterium]
MDKQTLLQLEQVTRTYEQGELSVNALDQVTLNIKKGEFLALAGPSGSGKTTLLNIAAGLDQPTKGKTFFLEKGLSQLSRRELAKLRLDQIGFVFQSHNLVPVLTAEENAEFILLLRGIPENIRKPRVQEILREVGLQGMEQRRPSELSGGQQQRVAVARALANRPSVILADEPTAALDSQRGRQVMELFGRVAHEQDGAVIVVTHDQRALDVFDFIYEMEDGRIWIKTNKPD